MRCTAAVGVGSFARPHSPTVFGPQRLVWRRRPKDMEADLPRRRCLHAPRLYLGSVVLSYFPNQSQNGRRVALWKRLPPLYLFPPPATDENLGIESTPIGIVIGSWQEMSKEI